MEQSTVMFNVALQEQFRPHLLFLLQMQTWQKRKMTT